MTRLRGLVPSLVSVGRLVVEVDRTRVLLVRSGDAVHATQALCSHRGAPLSDGAVVEDLLVCAWHRSAYRLADGSVVGGPATCPLTVLAVSVDGDDIVIEAAVR